jgi:2-polyprenyl-3-methyl-5-hydroxy-6-metoxy-1,4-benzoquinol methylase
MTFDDLRDTYPHFVRITSHLEETSALFMASALRQLRESQPDYEFAEKLCRDAYSLCGNDESRVLELASNFVEFSIEFLYLQRKLEKSGRYLYSTIREVEEQVYNDPRRKLAGAPYMWALYFSRVFWVTHCRVWRFFLSRFVATSRAAGCVLDVPSGNGLFLTHFLRSNPGWRGVGIDISDTAIRLSTDLLAVNALGDRAEIRKQDFFACDGREQFDRIICGEFLEHVEDPMAVIRRLATLVRADGRVFLTAAVWTANIDHIYLYESAEQVREHIRKGGFAVEHEFVQNVLPGGAPEGARTPVSYNAVLRLA